MSDEIKAEWHGMVDLLAELRELPDKIRERILIGAVAKGASVIKNEAVRLAPVWTGEVSQGHPPPGTLKRAIYQARLMSECTDTREVRIISVRQGKKYQAVKTRGGISNQDAFYAKWVEYGHYARTAGMTSTEHRKARSGVDLYTGAKWVPPSPFLRPAFATKQGEAFQAMREYIEKNLPAAVMACRFLKAAA